ncbi:hypothetical protein [Alishewanella longhuensis]|uniref:hypothetical protein n=1 Tax=Alishewanella longhuensis TaxID=1091037 RepID=UPI00167B12A7|nr:hypothetical protein [Alishewanella longhuensis]
MQTSSTSSALLFARKRQLIPGWFKFFCSLALIFYSLSYLVVSSYWFASTLPDFITINVKRTPTYFLIMSLFFVPFIVSFYGLLQGRNWGLYGCLILSYLAGAEHLYNLVITGYFGLGLMITVVVLVQLHKIKAAWAEAVAAEVSDARSTTAQ